MERNLMFGHVAGRRVPGRCRYGAKSYEDRAIGLHRGAPSCVMLCARNVATERGGNHGAGTAAPAWGADTIMLPSYTTPVRPAPVLPVPGRRMEGLSHERIRSASRRN